MTENFLRGLKEARVFFLMMNGSSLRSDFHIKSKHFSISLYIYSKHDLFSLCDIIHIGFQLNSVVKPMNRPAHDMSDNPQYCSEEVSNE